MNEVLIWIKDILGQYATPIIAVATFISGLIVIIKTLGLGKLFSGLKTLIASIFGKEENSPLNLFKAELKANISNLQNDFTKVKEDLTNELLKSQTQDIILGEMLSLIVENSTLPSEIKDKFNILKTKLNFNNDSDYRQNLLEEKKRLIEELESVKKLNELLTEGKQQETAIEIPQEKKSNIVVN